MARRRGLGILVSFIKLTLEEGCNRGEGLCRVAALSGERDFGLPPDSQAQQSEQASGVAQLFATLRYDLATELR